MVTDWDYVKKKTLWHYDDLIKKILNVFNYNFVQEYYNHTMPEAATYSERVRQGYVQGGKEAAFIGEITELFKEFDRLGIQDYLDLIRQVETKTKCETFLQETGFDFNALIQLLNYLFRWVLPFPCPVKELGDTIPNTDTSWLETLKQQKIRSSLDVIETFHTKIGREQFSKKTGLSDAFLLKLVHRADLSRLAYVRGKTIKHLCGGGYDTLDKLANTDMTKMESDMTAYYESLGKSFSDFKAVIPLDWMMGGARVLPRVVEE
jgi:hypothetical protein